MGALAIPTGGTAQEGWGSQKPSFNGDGRRRETAGRARNAKRNGDLGPLFTVRFRVIFLLRKF